MSIHDELTWSTFDYYNDGDGSGRDYSTSNAIDALGDIVRDMADYIDRLEKRIALLEPDYEGSYTSYKHHTGR